MNTNLRSRTPQNYLDQLRKEVSLKEEGIKQSPSQSQHGLPRLLEHINTEHQENMQ